MADYTFSKEEVRNYLINRSFLVQKAETVHEFFDTFGCIQVDPLVVIAKSHDLSLWNRVENYTNKTLGQELYDNRTLFEYWMQLYSIIPVKNRPFLSARMRVENSWHDEFYHDHHAEVEMAREYIIGHGVTSAKDLTHIPRTRAIFDWRNSDSGKATLDYLWDRGDITISHRSSNQKFYDLSERLIPSEHLGLVDHDISLDFLLRSHFLYLGLVRKFSILKTGRSIKDLLVKKFFQLVENGQVTKIIVEGVKTQYFVLTEEVENIKMLGAQNLHKGLNILPPLDPLLIDRQILKDFFDFQYLWEVYIPAHKRTFSHYGMPILYKGNLVGQVELTKNIATQQLDITKLQSAVNDSNFNLSLNESAKAMGEFVFTLSEKKEED